MKFDILTFSNLPNLQEINLGGYSFYKAGSFSLSGNNYSCSIDSLIFLISNLLRQDHIHSTILQNYLCRVCFLSNLLFDLPKLQEIFVEFSSFANTTFVSLQSTITCLVINVDVPFENRKFDISHQIYSLHDFSPNIAFRKIDSDSIVSDRSIFQIDH